MDLYNNKNRLSCEELDELAAKSLRLNIPEKMFPIFQTHRGLLYYPNPEIIKSYLSHFIQNNDYVGFREFYASISRNYFIKKCQYFYDNAIPFAYENQDYELITEMFLNISDYENLDLSQFLNIIVASNEYFMNDPIFVNHFKNYLNILHKKGIYNKDSIGVEFPLMLYNIKRLGIFPTDENKNLTTLEKYLNKCLNGKKGQSLNKTDKILYNRNIKLFIRRFAGSNIFKTVDKSILEFFDENMKVNIYDSNEIEVEEPVLKKVEFSKSQKSVTKQDSSDNKENVKEKEFVSLVLNIPKRASTDAKKKKKNVMD